MLMSAPSLDLTCNHIHGQSIISQPGTLPQVPAVALDYSTETKSAYVHASVSAVAFAGFCRPCMNLDTCMILDMCMTQDKGVGLV